MSGLATVAGVCTSSHRLSALNFTSSFLRQQQPRRPPRQHHHHTHTTALPPSNEEEEEEEEEDDDDDKMPAEKMPDGAKLCLTCNSEGHTWQGCTNRCAFCQQEHHRSPCPWNYYGYDISTKQEWNVKDAAEGRLEAEVKERESRATRLKSQDETLKFLANEAVAGRRVPATGVKQVTKKPEESKNSAILMLGGKEKDPWVNFVPELAGPERRRRKYAIRINAQARGQFDTPEYGCFARALRRAGNWPPPQPPVVVAWGKTEEDDPAHDKDESMEQ